MYAHPIIKAMTDSNSTDWPEDQPIPLSHPLVPEQIRQVIQRRFEGEEFVLHRVPTSINIEWWLFDQDGELLEAFWLE